MASIKTVLMEMLSTFDAKSRMGAKQLREQLHQGWPVSNSSVAMEQLGKELREEMRQSLEVVRKPCSSSLPYLSCTSLPLSLPPSPPSLPSLFTIFLFCFSGASVSGSRAGTSGE